MYLFPPLRAGHATVLDTAALVSFSVAGILAHREALPLTALLEDAVPLVAGWLASARGLGLYRRPTRGALLGTWALGVPAGVGLRAAVLGRLDEPRQLAFLATTLLLSLVAVAGARCCCTLLLASR